MPQDRCNQNDFGVFLALWNRIQNNATPAIHFRMAHWLQRCWERGERHLLLQAFRASGKSTLVGLFTAWLLCRDPDLRVLVLSAESSLAEKMVRTVRKVIEKHPLAKSLRPKNPDQWAADSFTVNRKRVSRDPSVLARGLFANITGSRADVVICDDVEVPNTCDTAEKRGKLRERLTENEFILVPGGLQIYIGTPHSYYSIYAAQARSEIGEDEPFLKNYKRLSIPLLNDKGMSAWPNRYDDETINRLRRMAGPAKFTSQMLLQPVNIQECRLDPALLKHYDAELVYEEVQRKMILSINGKKIVSASAWWDPAFGKASGDSSVLAVVYTDDAGQYYLHHLAYIKVEPQAGEDEATLQCQIIARLAREFYLPSIAIETNGIGKFLPAILRRELTNARVGCSVLEKSSTRSKDIRILEAFDAVLAARALNVHASVYQTSFMAELQEWKPGPGQRRDDGLDAAAGALGLEPVRLPRLPYDGARLWHKGGGETHRASSDFDV